MSSPKSPRSVSYTHLDVYKRQDVTGAIEERKQSSWSGTAPVTGERIMSVSAPIVSRNGTLIGVIRMVTSLSRADIQVVKIVAAALAVGATIVLLVYFSNLYFVRSIVEPVSYTHLYGGTDLLYCGRGNVL